MRNCILHGDSLQLIKGIEDCTIHAIISDIPYGIGYDDWDVLHNNTNYYDNDYKNCLYEVENLLSTILAVVTKMSISLDDLNSIRSLLYHILVLTDIALLKYTGEI